MHRNKEYSNKTLLGFWLRSKEYFENAFGLAGGLGSHGGSPNQGVTDTRRSAAYRHTEP